MNVFHGSAFRSSGRRRAGRAALARFPELAMPSLEYTDAVARETAHLYERVKTVIPAIEWPMMAPYVKAINDLKKVRNAVILAHNYQTPEIFHCVADYRRRLAAARRSRRPRPTPRSSSSAASTSWPRRRSCSIRTRRC